MDKILDRQHLKRITWIDCAKYCAIIAVAVDHSYTRLYQSQYIAYASYFSVTLFILLSGLSAQYSFSNRPQTVRYQLKKVGKMLLQYAVATFVIYIYTYKFFDLEGYLQALLKFSISPPFYFLVFFFQLLIISPYLLHWYDWCCHHKNAAVWHCATLVAVCVVSSLCIHHTYILPLHGGGQYLFGGTYLLVYYIGIMFGSVKLFNTHDSKVHWILLCISMPLWNIWIVLMKNGLLPFDSILQPIFGDGFNPPSGNFILFGIITCILFYSAFSLLEKAQSRLIQGIMKVFSVLGKYTLYVFMYHLLVQDIILKLIPGISDMDVSVRIFALVLIVTLPIFPGMIWKHINNKYNIGKYQV